MMRRIRRDGGCVGLTVSSSPGWSSCDGDHVAGQSSYLSLPTRRKSRGGAGALALADRRLVTRYQGRSARQGRARSFALL
jgi:hypothetical protein